MGKKTNGEVRKERKKIYGEGKRKYKFREGKEKRMYKGGKGEEENMLMEEGRENVQRREERRKKCICLLFLSLWKSKYTCFG